MHTTSDTEALKRAAAERAAEWIRDGMTLGLGTGSTVRHLLDVIAERRAAGRVGAAWWACRPPRTRRSARGGWAFPWPRWTSGRGWT